MFTVGYITYISDLKLEDQFPWLEKYFPERYETLKQGLTEGVAVPGFPAGFKVYEKEALIGIVLFILVDNFNTHRHTIKGSSDPSHLIFEINAGKSRIRHRTTLNLNDVIFNRF